MFSTHAIHLLHVILRDTLITLIILFSALFVWLKSGIEVDSLYFNHYEVEGLYIKLDKKLTLRANTITIPKSKQKPSFDNIDRVFKQVKYLLTFFHYIELENVDFKNNHYKVVYADNILYITSDDYEIAGNVWKRGKILVADISLFYIKKEDINVVAKLNYDLRSDQLILEGDYHAYHIQGRFKAIKKNQNVDFIINSVPFSDLKTVIDKIPLSPNVNQWITEKIQAKRYRLYDLSGRGKVHGSKFEVDLASLKGNALLEKATIDFQEGVSPVKAEKILLHYQEGTLGFKLEDATYKNRKIIANSVKISHMKKGETAKLDLDFSINSMVDQSLNAILKAYDIELPVLHRDSRSQIRVKLGLPLKAPEKEKIDLFVNVILGKGNLYIQKIKLPILGGEVCYEKGVATLKKIEIKAPWYEGALSGKVHTQSQKADLLFDAKNIKIGDGQENHFILHDKKIPFSIDYRKGMDIVVPMFHLKIRQNAQKTEITASDLAKIKPYFGELQIDIDGGSLTVTTEDFSDYRFHGNLYRKACFIYDDSVCYTSVPCHGTVSSGSLDFFAFGKRLHYNEKTSEITLKRLNIDLEKFLELGLRKGKVSSKRAKKGKIVIRGKKSNIRYNKYTLLTDQYTVSIFSPSGRIKASGNLGNDVVSFEKAGEKITIEALRIHDRMLHPLIHFNGLQDGRYTIRLSGVPNQLMKGEILLDGGVLKSFKAYDETRNFLQNNQALSEIQDPGFSATGFKIKNGKIDYRILKEKVVFDSIYIKGHSATIVGKGELNLKTKKLNINLAVQMVRKLGKIVGSVPVLGYILMGDDNSITFGLKITGTLDAPKVETSAAKEILMLPFDLIKRTIQSPAHLMKQEKEKKKTPVPVVEEVKIPKNHVAP
jgi:hypothetical protein